jgi:hypothetical protein
VVINDIAVVIKTNHLVYNCINSKIDIKKIEVESNLLFVKHISFKGPGPCWESAILEKWNLSYNA